LSISKFKENGEEKRERRRRILRRGYIALKPKEFERVSIGLK
jgi:hypothetical protein